MKELFKSLAAFQQETPIIHKDTQGYGYTYADMSKIVETINPLMAKHKLGFYQAVEGSQLKTVIFHVGTGESIESQADIPQGVQLKGMNDFQVLGSAITYLKRYSLSAMLGIVTDKDVDGAGEQVKKDTKASTQNNEEEKQWLNRTKRNSDEITQEWDDAVKAIERGDRTADDIFSQYKVNKECRAMLKAVKRKVDGSFDNAPEMTESQLTEIERLMGIQIEDKPLASNDYKSKVRSNYKTMTEANAKAVIADLNKKLASKQQQLKVA